MFNKRLLSMVPEARRCIIACVAFKWVSLVLLVAFLYLVAQICGLLLAGAPSNVALLLAGAAGCIAVRFVFDAGARWFGSKASAEAKASLRQDVYEKLVRMGPSFRETVGTSQAVQLCGEGIQQLETYLGAYMPQLFFAVLAPVTLFLCVLPLNSLAAVVLLVCVPLIPIAIMTVMRIAKRVMGDYWDSYVDLGASFLEAVQGLITLKVYQADGRRQHELANQAEDFRRDTMRLLRVQLNSVTIMDLFTFGGAAAGSAATLLQMSSGALSSTDALFIVLVALQFFLPMRTLGSYFHTAMGATPVIDQVFSVLDASEPPEGGAGIDPEHADIELSGVGYAYKQDAPVLHDLDLRVDQGSFVGITGASGSGKSTALGVMAGMLRSYEGSARIGGVEATEASASSLRAAVTYVASEGHVFKGTYRSNLLLGNLDADDYALWNALSKCRFDDYVLSQGGLDAPVAEGGSNLSGGQRQRLCLARAVLRDTPVYLFDEVTSNIDAEAERDILNLVQELAVFKTVVLVSHRLEALRLADYVYVIDGGRAVEGGMFSQLVEMGGVFARLWAEQGELEAFARGAAQATLSLGRARGEVDLDDVPEAMREAMNRMPASVATVALQSVKTARIKRLTESGSAVPVGHPADIPLPRGSGVVETETDADAEESRDDVDAGASSSCDDGGQTPVSYEPARTPLRQTVSGLMDLARELAPAMAWASLWGSLGFAAAIGLFVCAAAGVLGLAGQAGGIGLAAALVALSVCGVARGPLRYGERLVSHDGTFKTLALLRDRVFGHLRACAPARLEDRDAGDLIALLTSDIDLLEVFYAHTISPVVVAVVVSVAVVCGLAVIDPELAVVGAASFFLIGAVLPWVSERLMEKPGRSLRRRTVQLSSFLLESLQGLPEPIGFGCADVRAEELGGRMGALAGNEQDIARRSAVLGALSEALAYGCVLVAAAVAATQVQAEAIDAGATVLAVILLASSFDPVAAVAHLGTSLHQTLAAGARVLSLLDEDPATPEITHGERIASFTGAAADHVSFSYGDQLVLDGVDLAVTPGAVVHVAGKSGAGKSTLCKLFMRFWDVDSGAVCISGADVRTIQTSSLRSCECYLPQDTHLFSGTILTNLLVARPDATEEQLWHAVEAASFSDVVSRLPEGLDTMLGEAGTGLSAGERQRLGLARAFLSDASFMVLDEPTSNLDCLNEAAVLCSLADNREERTVLIVSHRPTAAAVADVTLTVDRGVVS